jgi:cyclic pyranopterin phosphate synthase
VVVMAGVNDDEILDFARKTINDEWHVRFIELMPFTEHNGQTHGLAFKELKTVSTRWQDGALQAFEETDRPVYRFPEAKGSSVSSPPLASTLFCCNRLRLTSDGKLRPCLMSEDMLDLREPLRRGISSDALKELIKQAVTAKPMGHHLVEGQRPNDRPFCQVGG